MIEKRSTPAPEAVAAPVRKNNFASPPIPPLGPLQTFCWYGFPWQYFYFILSTNGSVNLVFYAGWPQSHAPMLIKRVIVVTFIQIQSSLQGLQMLDKFDMACLI